MKAILGLQIVVLNAKNKNERYTVINNVIEFLNDNKNLECNTSRLETTIIGDFDLIMDTLKNAIIIASSNNKYTIFANTKIIYNSD